METNLFANLQFIFSSVFFYENSKFFKNRFYAGIYEGVEMRAEAALLTRNVLIHGKMENECYQESLNLCSEKINFDNFGGHIMTVEGFKSFNIEGAEITHMGQMAVKGR